MEYGDPPWSKHGPTHGERMSPGEETVGPAEIMGYWDTEFLVLNL